MLMEITYMHHGDRGIALAILELQSDGQNVDQFAIADRAGCSRRTVARTIARWKRGGQIIMIGSSRRGYTYEITDENLRPSI